MRDSALWLPPPGPRAHRRRRVHISTFRASISASTDAPPPSPWRFRLPQHQGRLSPHQPQFWPRSPRHHRLGGQPDSRSTTPAWHHSQHSVPGGDVRPPMPERFAQIATAD